MLKKSTFREIRTSIARYLAIFSIVALGVGFFSGLRNCQPSMMSTVREYLAGHNFYDYQLATSYGIDDDSVRTAEGHDGVDGAEGSIQIDVLAGTDESSVEEMRAISLPAGINTLRLTEGRLPESSGECVVDNYSITDDGYAIGETLILSTDNDKDKLKEFKKQEFKIVGKVNTPIFLDYQRGSTDIGDGSLSNFFFLLREDFDVDYYTTLYLTLDMDAEDFTDESKDKLKSEEEDMKSLAAMINDDRRETARHDAQDELDEKKAEYEDKLSEYESERYDAIKKIEDARAELDSAEKEINERESELNDGIEKLEAGIKQAEDGLARIESGISDAQKGLEELSSKREETEEGLKTANENKEGLEQAHAAGMMDDATYSAGTVEVDALIAAASEGLKQIDEKSDELIETVKDLEEKETDTEKTLEDLKSRLSEAESGRSSIKSARNDIRVGRQEIAEQEAEAYAEFDKAEKELADAKEKIDDAQKEIDEMETGNSYAISRLDNAGYSSFDSNSGIVSNIAKIFPLFFFLIAALVCMTTMTRMIEEHRGQIGVLKALGYSNAAIAAKYMFYSGSAALLGAVLGFFAGCKIFPTVIWNAYTMMYDFSDTVDYVISPLLGAATIVAALACSMGATWVSIRQDFTVAPSELIRPRTLPPGKRILMERIKPLWSRIGFLYKVSFRNIFRDKRRFVMMVMGISGCTALLIAGFGIRTSIAKIAEYQFDEISLYDFVTVFSKDMDEKRQDDFKSFIKESGVADDNMIFLHQAELTAIMNGGSEDLTCTAVNPEGFDRFISLHRDGEPIDFPGAGEAVIVSKLNHDYGVDVGDEITLRDGFREMKVRVSAVCDNYVYDNIYISSETYKEGFGVDPEIKTAMIRMPDGTSENAVRRAATRAANYDDVAAISLNADVKDNVDNMMKSLDSVIYVVIMSAALLAFIVLYNLTNINITERIREIATIKVLGFFQRETSSYVFRENLFLTVVAVIVGIPLGRWLLKFVIDNIVVKMVYFEPKLTNTDIIMSVLLTFVFSFIVDLAMQRRLINVSMTESLKSVE